MTFGQSSDENSVVIPTDNGSNNLVQGSKEIKLKQSYQCHFCHERFRNKDALDRHEYHHTKEKKYKCSFVGCPKSFTNVSHLRRHNKQSHSNQNLVKTVICLDPHCAVLFTTDDNMRRHYREIHLRGNQFVCNTCGETFRRKQQLKRHSIIHTGNYPYRCEICNKGAVSLKAHIRHRASHIHDCEICGRVFKNWSGLVAHRKISHTIESKVFECETCKKNFASQRNLNYHQKVHLEPEERLTYQCPYEKCANFYFEKRNLNAHIRSKHEGRKFICGFEDCGREISTKQKLELHLKLHLSEKSGTKSKQCSRRNSTETVQKVRKDKGKKKVSAVSILSGVEVIPQIEKNLLENKGFDVIVPEKYLPTFVNSSDISDVESANEKSK
uniref:CSON007835 protein n=1 Tax=Culicoides sonorensis TaxID=179676 RepID=A0A336LE39_CULSO